MMTDKYVQNYIIWIIGAILGTTMKEYVFIVQYYIVFNKDLCNYT